MLRPWEVALLRVYLPGFPVLGLVAGLGYNSYSTLFMGFALPALQWLGLPDHQRRQVLGTRRHKESVVGADEASAPQEARPR